MDDQIEMNLSRRELLRNAAMSTAALLLPEALLACSSAPRLPDRGDPIDPDLRRLTSWTGTLRAEGSDRAAISLGSAAIRVGELATGTPYVPYTLDAYLASGGDPSHEPLTLSLSRFDCVTLVESCLAVARVARAGGPPTLERLGREIERMRYRGGRRSGYASRLHYFSEWITDGERRGLVKDLGSELGAGEDQRPLRFMTEHREKYRALRDPAGFVFHTHRTRRSGRRYHRGWLQAPADGGRPQRGKRRKIHPAPGGRSTARAWCGWGFPAADRPRTPP